MDGTQVEPDDRLRVRAAVLMPGEEEPTLFNLAAAEDRAHDGTRLAEDAGRVQEWRVRALEALDQLADSSRPFIADDLVAIVGLPDKGLNKNNAVGAVIQGAARRGVIVHTGNYRRSARLSGHARVVAEWIGNPNRFPVPQSVEAEQPQPSRVDRLRDRGLRTVVQLLLHGQPGQAYERLLASVEAQAVAAGCGPVELRQGPT